MSADVFQIPARPPSRNRYVSPYSASYSHSSSHDFAARPNAIFSTLQGTQNPDTKPTLQRAKNANAQPTHPSGRNSYQLHQDILS